MKMPLVRVVIPTYNRQHMLSEAIASVLAQSFSDFEVIIADDGSTDDTQDVVAPFLLRDPRIRFCHFVHSGVASTRNKALKEAGQYKYVAFLDSDDLWTPRHLERAVAALESEPNVAVFFGRFDRLDMIAEHTNKQPPDPRQPTYKPLTFAQFSQNCPWGLIDSSTCRHAFIFSEFIPKTSTTVVRRDAVKRSNWFDPTLAVYEDHELFLYLAVSGFDFAIEDVIHAHIRRFGDNLTGEADLLSPVFLRRYRSVLQYYQMKLDLAVESAEIGHVRRQIAEALYLIAQGSVEQSNRSEARDAYRRSLRYHFSYKAAKGLLFASLPSRLYSLLRMIKTSLKQAIDSLAG